MMDLSDLAKMLERAAARCRPELEADLVKIGALVQPLAAEYIGHEMPEWAPLAPSTIAEKEKLGYVGQVSATDPRLRTGADRDSIGVTVEGLQLAVGSSREIFRYQELGTAHIPPRPVLEPAMEHSLAHAADVLGKTARELLRPGAKR